MNGAELLFQKFGRLTVIARLGNQGAARYWECLCECGKKSAHTTSKLRTGTIISCGCWAREKIKAALTKHGQCHTRTYRIWHNMKDRCLRPLSKSFPNYGGRGISICDRWKDFRNFIQDMGESPKGMTLERIDNNGNYEPGNCKWATVLEQHRNTRRSKLTQPDIDVIRAKLSAGQTQKTIAGEFGVSQSMVSRIKSGDVWPQVR